MIFGVRRKTLNFAEEYIVAFPEVRVRQCDREPVVAVCDINQTWWQAFSWNKRGWV